ncbi:MAG: YhbY family RNA-binding protein [Casimicrobiaceae bacterium]
MPALTPTQRRDLRARAHPLDPVVAIGQHGLTPPVMHEIDVALRAHELIKVRVFGDERAARQALMEGICAELGCAPVQHIGKLLVLWRPNPEKQEKAAKARMQQRPAKAPAPHAAAAAKRGRTRADDAPAGKRAPAARRRRGSKGDAAPPPPPRGDQARRRRRTEQP